MKDLIVSFATKGREAYHTQLLRLIDSCKEHWPGDLLIYSPDHDLWMYRDVQIHHSWPDPEFIQSYTHKDMPYQFKTAMIQKGLELGYKRIIWLDSSMQLKKDLTPLFGGKYGVTVFENLGHPTYKYINDNAVRLLESSGFLYPDVDLRNIPQMWGGAFAFDFTNEYAREAFEAIKIFSVNGSFKDSDVKSTEPEFVAHRHDQSVMSVILYRRCKMLPYGQILCPPHDTTGEYGRDPYLVCRGL